MAPSNDDDGDEEYLGARRLVKRAAEREDLLTSKKKSSSSQDDGYEANFSNMRLKPDHIQRPTVRIIVSMIPLMIFMYYSPMYLFLCRILPRFFGGKSGPVQMEQFIWKPSTICTHKHTTFS